MMKNELGIANLEKFAEGFLDVGGIIDRARADGEIDQKDIPEAFKLLNILPKFADSDEAVAEFKDLVVEEVISLKSNLRAYAQSKYPDDDDDAIEKKIDKGLAFALSGVEFFKEF